jgi:hypothetical protein
VDTPSDSSKSPWLSESGDRIESLLSAGFLRPPALPGLAGQLGRFHVIRLLGEGAAGIVLLSRDPESGELVAIKLLKPELLGYRRVVDRFRHEARLMKRLSHPNILPVLEESPLNETPYYVTPYLSNGSLAQRTRSGRPMDDALALGIARQVTEALWSAYDAGVIHRDVKPENVLMGADGRAYLADFGLGLVLAGEPSIDLRETRGVGTAPYMSPGLVRGETEDTRGDIYALGAMLYEMLAGRPPYTGRDSAEIFRKIREGAPIPLHKANPQASAALVAIIEWAMARELRDRYASLRDVIGDLERAKRGEAPLGPRGRPRGRSLQLALVGLAAAAGTLVAGAVGYRWLAGPGPAERDVATTTSRVPATDTAASADTSADLEGCIEQAYLYISRPKASPEEPPGMFGFTGNASDILTNISQPPAAGHQATCKVVLKRRAWCYVLLVHPDGTVETVFPKEDRDKGRQVSRLTCPDTGDKGVVLKDSGGLYAFVVLAARRPLQAGDIELRPKDRELWRHAVTQVFWRSDGDHPVAAGARRELDLAPSPPAPSGLSDVCKFYAGLHAVADCRVVAFSVRKSDESPAPSSGTSPRDREAPKASPP